MQEKQGMFEDTRYPNVQLLCGAEGGVDWEPGWWALAQRCSL